MPVDPLDPALSALTDLGFTPLEAEIYAWLLRDGPGTGYRVAQALGRPVGGVYKALEALANRGAVQLDEGQNRLARAIPAEELLSRLERQFVQRRTAADRALADLGGGAEDDRIYQLRDRASIMERCRTMLSGCRELALVDGFPKELDLLRPELSRLAGRAPLAVQTYADWELEGAQVSHFPPNHPVPALFPGRWLFLVADGREFLLAIFGERDEVLQAVWTASPYLTWAMEGFIVSELVFVRALEDPEMPQEAKEIVRRYRRFFPEYGPAYRNLLQRFGRSLPCPGPSPDPGSEES